LLSYTSKQPLLLFLIFFFIFPDILEIFLKATPNLEVLHIGYSNRSALDPWTPLGYSSSQPGTGADCLKMILRCDRLTTLSLNAFCLFEGDFFEAVIAQFQFSMEFLTLAHSISDIQRLSTT